jgi:hypothetical protein
MSGFEEALWCELGYFLSLYSLIYLLASPFIHPSHFVVCFSLLWGIFLCCRSLFRSLGSTGCIHHDHGGFTPSLGLTVAALTSIDAVFHTLIPAWTFRRFKGETRIGTIRNVGVFVLFGGILPDIVSKLIGPSMWDLFRVIPNIEAMLYVSMPSWFISSTIATLIIGSYVLMMYSQIAPESPSPLQRPAFLEAILLITSYKKDTYSCRKLMCAQNFNSQ